jgi:hypothetical protein
MVALGCADRTRSGTAHGQTPRLDKSREVLVEDRDRDIETTMRS